VTLPLAEKAYLAADRAVFYAWWLEPLPYSWSENLTDVRRRLTGMMVRDVDSAARAMMVEIEDVR